MRALLAGLSLSVFLHGQLLPGGPPKVQRVIPAEAFQLLVLKQVAPAYPAEAQAANVQGNVLLTVQIDGKGNIQSIQALRGPAILRSAAMDALKQLALPAVPGPRRSCRPCTFGSHPTLPSELTNQSFATDSHGWTGIRFPLTY